jgi:predicted dehydrogenase
VAAADVDGPRLSAFCADNQVPEQYDSLAQLIGEARPELVHLCTPPALHHRQASACLRAGVSVLTEKPPALSLYELDQLALAQAERRQGVGPAVLESFTRQP